MVVTEMALSNYQRQKKWRDNNRALHNLRRRNARKDLSGSKEQPGGKIASEKVELESRTSGVVAPPAQLSKIEQLRELIANPVVETTKPLIYKDDYGRIISEHQWHRLQELKAKAKDGGYVLDDYTQ